MHFQSECERLQDSLRAVLPAEVASRWAIVVKDDETRMVGNPSSPRDQHLCLLRAMSVCTFTEAHTLASNGCV